MIRSESIFAIEPATAQDVDAILVVMKSANMHYVPSLEMKEIDYRDFFIARCDGFVAGAAGYLMLSPTISKTTLMAVYPQKRGCGIGYALQERRMQAALDKGARTMVTNADRPSTIAWYKRHFGYREVGRLPKLHEFGDPSIHEWITLETDLVAWSERYALQI